MALDAMSISEAAKRLGVGRNAAYEAARQGQLPVLRIGRRLLVPKLALENLLRSAGADKATPSPVEPTVTDARLLPAARFAATAAPNRKRPKRSRAKAPAIEEE